MGMFYNVLVMIFKFTLVAVVVGALLNLFNISAEGVLKDIGFTPSNVEGIVREGFDWAWPHFMLGALILIPVWLVVFLLKPPRIGK